jgi:hypothetical protein
MTDASVPAETPLEPSFPQAMEITARWLGLWETGELSDEVLADRVGALVVSRNGARGFFVVSLSGDSPLMDRLPDPLVAALQKAGDGVVDLVARNLAMSTAMGVHHHRSGDREHQAGSERVQQRSTDLLRQLEAGAVKRRLESLLAAAGNGEDPGSAVAEDRAMLDRWGYDAGQRRAIVAAIEAVAE